MVRINYHNRQGRVGSQWKIRCKVQGPGSTTFYKTANGIAPMMPGRLGMADIDVGSLPAGNYSLTVQLDYENSISEENETNNNKTEDAEILTSAITKIDDQMTKDRNYQGRPMLKIWLKNNGNQDITQASVHCTMDGEKLSSLSGGPTYNPGDEKSFIVITRSQYSQLQEGLHSIRCECEIWQPRGVTDVNSSNNVLTGTVRVGEKPDPHKFAAVAKVAPTQAIQAKKPAIKKKYKRTKSMERIHELAEMIVKIEALKDVKKKWDKILDSVYAKTKDN